MHFSQEFQELLPVTSLHHQQQQQHHAGVGVGGAATATAAAVEHVVDHLIPMTPFDQVIASDGSAVNAHFIGNVEQVLEFRCLDQRRVGGGLC
jgi:hypothetical protein